MAVTITDTRITPTNGEADATTGWTGSATPTLFTADPNPVEATGSLGMAVSIATADIYVGMTSANLSDTLIYVWTLPNGTMDTEVNGGVGVVLFDGTNRIGFHTAGSDVAGFRHESGPVGWQCQILDTTVLPSAATARAGTVGGLNTAAITGIGAMYKTLSKALGGGSNCFTDVVRYGTGGLRITAGTVGSPGKFSEIASADRASTSGQAYGIIRELGAGLYGLQGPLTFGDTAGTATTYFADTDASVVFESRGIGTSRYFITVQGNATGSTTFQLGTQIGTSTSGSNGCTLTCPPGVGAAFTATDADLQYLFLYGSTFSGFNNGFSFSTNATNGPNHEVYGNTFIACAQIDPGQVQFKNNSISATTASTTGAILLDSDGSDDWADLSFTSGGTGHAIYITAIGTYTLSNFAYSGYSTTSPGSNLVSSSGSTDAVIYNNSGGAVTLNISGGDTPTVRNGAGATTTVNQNVNLTVTIKNQAGEPIPGVEVAIFQDNTARTVVLASTPTDELGEVTTTSAASLGAIIIRARQSTNIASFLTSASGIDGATEIITTSANHNFRDGDAVVYRKNGGTAVVGLTADTTYYVNSITATTLSLHTTAADAIADISRVNLTAAGTETHLLDPIRYVAAAATGTIGAGDFSAQITMITDHIATG